MMLISSFFACNYLPQKHETEVQNLGHYLFFETALSANNTKSCASCHAPQFAFTDGYKRSLGIEADIHPRNAQGLINVANFTKLNWANPDISTLEEQIVHPLFNVVPLEMGAKKEENTIPNRLKNKQLYQSLFKKAFPKEANPYTWENIVSAIAAYCRTLKSMQAPYDKYKAGDTNAISTAAKRGEKLFFSRKTKCMACHTPPLFSSADDTSEIFANVGLYENYPKNDNGVYEVTHKEGDKGKFRIPSLRNLVFTSPYMHDGSMKSLREIIDMYARGGRKIDYGEWQGDGAKHPNRDRRVQGFDISEQEKDDILAFLLCLTDSTILTNPQFQDPKAYK